MSHRGSCRMSALQPSSQRSNPVEIRGPSHLAEAGAGLTVSSALRGHQEVVFGRVFIKSGRSESEMYLIILFCLQLSLNITSWEIITH